MKRILCLLLALILCAGLTSSALASEEASEEIAPADTTAEAATPPEAPDDAAEILPAEESPEEPPADSLSEEDAAGDAPSSDGAGPVPVDEEHFPDQYFRRYVSDNFDSDRSGALDEAELAAATEITLGGNNPTPYDSVKSLQGIGLLPALSSLTMNYIGRNWIGESTRIEMDLSGNPALKTLVLHCTVPLALDLSGNPALTTLELYSAGLTELDISKNAALTSLSCYLNSLTSLDTSRNPALTELNCGSNDLTALDLRGNPLLTSLNCRLNDLAELDVSGCPALTYLDCCENRLTALDVSGNTALTTLYCHRNQLSALDLTNNAILENLQCSENPMKELRLGNNGAITSLSCTDSQLETLVVTDCAALESLVCSGNRLTALDLSGCPVLESLECSGNLLTTLDVRGCPALESLYCQNNRLTLLNVTGTKLAGAMEKFRYHREQGYQWYIGFAGGVYYALVTDDTARLLPRVARTAVPVGEVIRFGRYEQDNDLSNGPEPIEWVVLDREGDRLLVVSKYILDKKPFNSTQVPVTYPDYMSWESCSLRAWLNGGFADAAFTETEKSLICTTSLSTEPTHYGLSTGASAQIVTEDRVFVLSSREVKQYFKWAGERGIKPNPYTAARLTAYAAAQDGMQADPYNSELFEYGDERYQVYDELPDSPWFVMDRILQAADTLSWTLRETDGRERYDTAWVSETGRNWWDCGYMMTTAGGIRPAMWIAYEPDQLVEKDPYDADGDGEYTVRDAALLLPESPRMAAEVLLDVSELRPLPKN